jgi:hypothetical protein
LNRQTPIEPQRSQKAQRKIEELMGECLKLTELNASVEATDAGGHRNT